MDFDDLLWLVLIFAAVVFFPIKCIVDNHDESVCRRDCAMQTARPAEECMKICRE